MYITYCRNQKSVDAVDRTNYRLSVTGGEYRPTWLVRVSDWQKVPGTEAVEGYHTISYCWEQSGEVVKDETDDGNDEYDLVDNGKHCIVEGYNVGEGYVYHGGESSESDENEDDDQEDDDQEDCEYGDEKENFQDNFEDANSVDKEDNEDINNKDNEVEGLSEGSEDDSDSDEEKELSDAYYVTWCFPTSESA
ncbi:hypothetical protein BDC45DRAFT_610564, partial [Circinella umbellata]